jgi:SAM-dependent methyltransferase
MICSLLPSDWSFAGKSVLDFGCGPGRVLRHFTAEARECSFRGCDIDVECVNWLAQHLVPPFEIFANKEDPPLPFRDGSFDLIYATSVFTHLADTWADWLAELRRLLRGSGLLFMTFLGSAEFAPRSIGGEWADDQIGLTMVDIRPPAVGGSTVVVSDWWIRSHLTRGFDILDMRPDGWGAHSDRPGRGQGMLLMRRNDRVLSADGFLEPEPDEPREWLSAQFNLKLLRREILNLRAEAATASSSQPDPWLRRARSLRRTVSGLGRHTQQ